MSVIASDRTPNKLVADQAARDYAEYTIRLCHNNRYFPKSERWTLGNRIVDLCVNIVITVRVANAIVANTAEKANSRTEKQWEVVHYIRSAYAIMDIAYQLGHIPSEKMTAWVGLCNVMEKKVIGWLNSDTKKYKETFKEDFKY